MSAIAATEPTSATPWDVVVNRYVTVGSNIGSVFIALMYLGRWARRHFEELRQIKEATKTIPELSRQVQQHLDDDDRLFRTVNVELKRVEDKVGEQADALEEHRRRGEEWRLDLLERVAALQRKP